MLAEFTINGKRYTGKVIKENLKTILVTAPDGKTVKRHKEKHGVKLFNK